MRRVLAFFSLACLGLGVAVGGWIAWARGRAPSRDKMAVMMTAATIKRDQANGEDKCLFPLAITHRQVSPALKKVILSAEDRDFFHHSLGVSLRGLVAGVARSASGGKIQGGSGITQQLVKNVLFEPGDNRWRRKLFEVPWAIAMNARFSKDAILDAYLNKVPFRHGLVGVEAASIYYFGKHADALNHFEAALLEVMLSNPGTDLASQNARIRRRTVRKARNLVAALVKAGLIPASALREGVAKGRITMPDADCGYVRDYAVKQAQAQGWIQPGVGTYRIFLTIDPKRQVAARAAVDDVVSGLERRNGSQIALVDLDRSGRILALQGGVDYAESQYNRAAFARRSPGSLGKTIVLAEACEQGWSLDDPVLDVPLPGGRPANHRDRYYGQVPLGQAFALSLNAAFFRLAQRLGPDKIAARARAFGVTGPMPRDGGVAVGDFSATPLEMTAAFETIANGGYRAAPYLIAGVTSSYGKIAYWRKDEQSMRPVLSARCVAMVDRAMRDVVRWGTGHRANLDEARGKTGTSTDYRDAWFVGYTGRGMVVGIWTGNDDQRFAMNGMTGGDIPAQTFSAYIARVNAISRPDLSRKTVALIDRSSAQGPDLALGRLADHMSAMPVR